MNRNENETESFAGNFAASEQQRLFFEVPRCSKLVSTIGSVRMVAVTAAPTDQRSGGGRDPD
jgi:hypothetical protein